MNCRKYLLPGLLFLSLLLLGRSGSAQTLNEYIRADSLRVGDRFELSITLSRTGEYDEVIFPDSTHFGDIFEMQNRQHFKVSTYRDSVRYQLQFFGTTDTLLPSLPVLLVQNRDTTTLYTDPVPVSFRSLLADSDEEFRPLKPIFDFAADWWPYILGFLLLLGAAAAIWYYLTRREPKPEPEPRPDFEPAPFLDPLKELENTLEVLQRARPSTGKQYEEFYVSLGDAIREYFEVLYKIPALESTSREIIQQLESRAIDENLVRDTKDVLREADMVKFANFTPTGDQAGRALEKGYDFLDRARQVDGPRISHLRRRHLARTEKKREEYYQKPETEPEDTA